MKNNIIDAMPALRQGRFLEAGGHLESFLIDALTALRGGGGQDVAVGAAERLMLAIGAVIARENGHDYLVNVLERTEAATAWIDDRARSQPIA